MFKKLKKTHLAILAVGVVIICAILMKTFMGGDFVVKFTSTYAEVGKELSVEVDGAKKVTYEWTIGGEIIENDTNSYTPTEDDLEKWIEVRAKSMGKTSTTNMYFSKLPVVYIDTNGAAIESKEDYVDAMMMIQGNATYDSETTTLYDGVIEIRGRGNTTWEKPKKPYKIKLDEKTDVFGMGENKHWVLLANYLDESLMRNTLAYDLSGAMGMEQMSTVWVDVVMNGEYVGNYQFCEQIRVDDTRVDVFDWEGFAEDSAAVIAEAEGLDEDDLVDYMLENMEWITSDQVEFEDKTYQISNYEEIEIPSINGGYILEIDEYYDEVSKFKTTTAQPVMFKNPEFVATNDDMMAYVKAYVQAFEYAAYSTDYTATHEGKEVHYSDLYDLDALVDYWIVNEIFNNEDFNKKSTYMHKDIDGLMKMGPIWDMDWSSGAAGTSTTLVNKWATLNFRTNAQAGQWYRGLVKDPYFLMKLQERYLEIRETHVQDMLDSIDVYYEYLKESGAVDSELWTKQTDAYMNGRGVTFEKDVANLRNWLNHHVAWIDEQMETEDAFVASFINKGDDITLGLTDASGNELKTDTAKKAPADAVDKTGKDLVLKISADVSGDVDIYINGRKCDTIQMTNGNAEYVVKAEKLTAEAGKKNVIEVKVRDDLDDVLARDYVTVKVK